MEYILAPKILPYMEVDHDQQVFTGLTTGFVAIVDIQ